MSERQLVARLARAVRLDIAALGAHIGLLALGNALVVVCLATHTRPRYPFDIPVGFGAAQIMVIGMAIAAAVTARRTASAWAMALVAGCAMTALIIVFGRTGAAADYATYNYDVDDAMVALALEPMSRAAWVPHAWVRQTWVRPLAAVGASALLVCAHALTGKTVATVREKTAFREPGPSRWPQVVLGLAFLAEDAFVSATSLSEEGCIMVAAVIACTVAATAAVARGASRRTAALLVGLAAWDDEAGRS